MTGAASHPGRHRCCSGAAAVSSNMAVAPTWLSGGRSGFCHCVSAAAGTVPRRSSSRCCVAAAADPRFWEGGPCQDEATKAGAVAYQGSSRRPVARALDSPCETGSPACSAREVTPRVGKSRKIASISLEQNAVFHRCSSVKPHEGVWLRTPARPFRQFPCRHESGPVSAVAWSPGAVVPGGGERLFSSE